MHKCLLTILLLFSLPILSACSSAINNETSAETPTAETTIEYEVEKPLEPGTPEYENSMWRKNVCANFPEGLIEDTNDLQMDDYLSEEDYLNSFKWQANDSVTDVSTGGKVDNEFISQDLVDAITSYLASIPEDTPVDEKEKAFLNWFDAQPLASEYTYDINEQCGGPAVMRRAHLIYFKSKNGKYDYTYGIMTNDCDVLVADLNTSRVLFCERAIENSR